MNDLIVFLQKNWPWLSGLGAILIGSGTVVIAKIRALEKGVQALLRAQMINDWNKYSDKGSAPIYARQSFENLWEQYEKLGKNGVMEDLRQKFLALPIENAKGETR